MLQSLRIRNLALLEEVELEFESGFTAVTGETGAGKSILLGALGLLAGERADKTLIRQGASACEVEASLYFKDCAKIDALLAELDLPASEEGVLFLKRSLPRERPTKITVNGKPLATLAALQKPGESWIDFHGPSEPRRLLKEACQLELLDLFGRAQPALAAYEGRYREWRGLISERERVAGETRLSSDEIAFLEGRLSKLDSVDLSEKAVAILERAGFSPHEPGAVSWRRWHRPSSPAWPARTGRVARWRPMSAMPEGSSHWIPQASRWPTGSRPWRLRSPTSPQSFPLWGSS